MVAKKVVFILTVVLLSASALGLADSITSSAGGGWIGITSAVINENGNPYWDNHSNDHLSGPVGDKLNIGYCLTTTNCPVSLGNSTKLSGPFQAAGQTFNYWGKQNSPTGAYDPNFYLTVGSTGNYWIGLEDTPFSRGDKDFNDMIIHMTPSGPGSDFVTIVAQLSPYSAYDTFGWYDINAPSILHPIVGQYAPAGHKKSDKFTPSANYGFYFENSRINDTWYSQASLYNRPGERSGNQHLAIFMTGSPSVPEPATLTLFGTGLIGLAGLLRRKAKSLRR